MQMSDLEDIIIRVADFIKRYRCIKTIKIKFTLGKYCSEFGFEKHIFHKENYDKIESLLNNCSTWEYVSEKHNEKFKSEPEKIVDSIIICCKNGPYDIMVTAETKKETDTYVCNEFSSDVKIFKRKCHIFNISQENTDLNEKFYRVNIIASIPDKYTDTYIAHSSLLKVQDLIKTCADTQDDLIFSILQKNN